MALTVVDGGMLSATNAQYTMFKNRLINGGMGIWQRGTSGFTTLGNYSTDRWIVSSNTSLSAVSRSTDVPSGFQYSLSVAGTNYPTAYQRIESVNCTDLVGQNVTLSFWLKQTSGTPGANSAAVAIYSPTATDNYTSVNTIASSGFTGSASWTYYSYTINSLPASVANGLQIVIYNNLAGASTFLVTGVQLEKGSTATAFDYRPYGTELSLCQRYYERQVWSTGNAALLISTGYTSAVANVFQFFKFAVEKRTAATTTKLGTWSVSSFSQPIVYGSDTFGCSLYCTSTGAVSSPYALAAGSGQGFDASAEL